MEMLETTEELSSFLREYRARVQPAEVALRSNGSRRRVPGLRREELSQLAGISLSYYTRIEQGKVPRVSGAVLDALARVLRMSEHDSARLRALSGSRAHRGDTERQSADAPTGVTPSSTPRSSRSPASEAEPGLAW
jgi:transcriptional regulator with XRE-family HTH domain